MIYRLEKDMTFGSAENSAAWELQEGGEVHLTSPVFFQLDPRPAWGEGVIPFTVIHKILVNGKLVNGIATTLTVPFPELNLETTLLQIMQSFFEHHPQYHGATFVSLKWENIPL